MISFALTEDQQMVQETVRRFAADQVRPRLRELERAGGVPADLQRQFDALALTLVDVPDALGGLGLGSVTAVLIHEELAWGDPGAAVALWAPHSLPAALLELATPEQATLLLGGLGRGALAWSEQGRGLPEAGFATTARRDGDGWILDGEKAFVINGDLADTYVVCAQIDKDRGWGGVGAFVVRRGTPGLTAGARHEWLGLETVSASTVALQGCRVAEEDRLAATSEATLGRMFARLQLVTAARQVGLARAAYEATLAFAQDRVAFGKPIAHFQAVSFTLVEMLMDLDSARWMVWRAAAELDRGAAGAVTSIAKAAVHANQVAWRVADDAVQLHGGAGYIKDFPVEKWLRDTKTLALVGHSDQLAELLIAAATLARPDEFGANGALPVSWIQPIVT